MYIFIIGGVLFFCLSYLFVFAPGIIIKLSEIGNKMVFTDYTPVAHRKLSGLVLFALSIIMFYLGFSL